MKISFGGSSFQKLCESPKKLLTKWGSATQEELELRLTEFRNAETLAVIDALGYPRLHWLKGSRKGQLAVDLDGSKRLILKSADPELTDYKDIKHVVLVEIVRDYH